MQRLYNGTLEVSVRWFESSYPDNNKRAVAYVIKHWRGSQKNGRFKRSQFD